jgi:ribonuclease-3
MEMTNLEYIQLHIGYTFKNKGLLCQAFTRKSYTEENKNALHNEVLEFYGDKALDFIVMKKMCENYGRIGAGNLFVSSVDEGSLTDIKKKLVCREMLAKKIRELDFHKRLILGKSDYLQRIWEQESVQEDLFEAILGAVAIDSDWDVEVLTRVVDRMLNPEFYFKKGFDESMDYVGLIQQWYQKKYGQLPLYTFTTGVRSPELFPEISTESRFQCDVTIAPFPPFKALGKNKNDARMAAAEKAYRYLEKGNLLLSLVDEVGVPELDRAINQLQELYQKGYISEPQYTFMENHD